MAAHRYWRLYCLNGIDETHFDIQEIELRTSIGGADVTGSGTASASAASSGFEASKAFDNNNSTTWYTPASNRPAWIKYDFGAGNDKDIVEVALKAWNVDEMVSEFDLQYSDDNSTWTTLFSILNPAATDWSTSAFTSFSASNHPKTSSANKQLWRVRPTTVDGGAVFGIAELRMFVAGSATTACTGGTPCASSQQESGGPVTEAFDGSSGTLNYWSAGGIANQWIGYKFSATKEITVIGITARDTFQNQAPKDFVLEYWDGSAFVTAFSITGQTGWASQETRYFNSSGLTTAPTASAAPRLQVCACT